MSGTAQVNVIHSILTKDGWIPPGRATFPTKEALEYQANGNIEIISVDGEPYIQKPCCGE